MLLISNLIILTSLDYFIWKKIRLLDEKLLKIAEACMKQHRLLIFEKLKHTEWII